MNSSPRPAARCAAPVTAPLDGVSIDSRSVAPGDIFVAIKGERHDGHDFVARGAEGRRRARHRVAADATRWRAAGPLLVVDDPLRGAREHRAARRGRAAQAQIIAVTGSVGKTSTKEMLRLALSASGHTHASVASFNNHWGVPLTLARMPRETRLSACSRSA